MIRNKHDMHASVCERSKSITHGSEGLSYGSGMMMVKTSWLKTERFNLNISELEPKLIQTISQLHFIKLQNI